MGTEVTTDANYVVALGGSMLEGEVNIVQDTYSHIYNRLLGEGIQYITTYNTPYTVAWTWKINNYTHIKYVELLERKGGERVYFERTISLSYPSN